MVSDTLAHDINNLLTIVAGCRERLAANAALTPEQRADLQRIAVATAHAGSLTTQLMQSGRELDSARPASDLTRAIADVVTLLAPAFGGSIRLDLHASPEAQWVAASDAEISQVLINLALNARDAMAGGGVLSVTTTAAHVDAALAERHRLTPGDYVVIEVADTGTGMTPETRAQAFERFFTAKDSGGTGLGLASVKRVIERRGGAVDLHSVAGGGTKFTLWLPRADTPPEGAAASTAESTDAIADSRTTVLVIDDEPVIRDIVTENLHSLGYRTVSAGSASEALRLAARERIDVFVTDLDLPDARGLDLTARLAATSPGARVLVISGAADGRVAASLPGSAFLQKPFTRAALARSMRELLAAPPASTSTPPAAQPAPAEDAPNALLDTLPAAVFVVQGRRFAYVNTAFAELMGLEPVDLIGRDSFERVHPHDRSIAPDDVTDDHSGGLRSVTQVRIRRPDGSERSLGMTSVGVLFEGHPAILGTAVDLTLQPDVLNVSVRIAALGRLAGGVAHDFNNLLLVIGGQIDRLRRAVDGSQEVAAGLETIATAAERAAMLTDRLLSFGRRQHLTPQVLDLSGVIAEVEPQLRARLGSAVQMVVDRIDDLPPIRADRPRLREVLWHLADNARDAMPEGGTMTIAVDRVRIDSDLKARWAFLALGGEFVRLRVVDTGVGMNPEVMPHVFEPFFTTKGRGRGAGMGLASVYGIVKQSAGYVFVERTGSEGTCVTILLPAADSRDEAGASDASASAPDSVSARPRVLLVEDDMAVRELLADLLAAHGFEVSAAETAEQAEAQAAHESFDLLLSDIDLPGMSGARLAAALAARSPGLRLILMSGYPDDGEIARAQLQNKVTLLRKPFSTTTLVDRIKQVLGLE